MPLYKPASEIAGLVELGYEGDEEEYDYEEHDDEEPDHNASNEDEKLNTLTPILYDMMHAIGSIGKHWGDVLRRAAPINDAKNFYSEEEKKEARDYIMTAAKEHQETKENPFYTVRVMNMDKLSLAFGDDGLSNMLTNELGYKLMHRFAHVEVYWFENDDCQISIIFLHKPWYIAFLSHPMFGKGHREPYSGSEIEFQALIAITHTWQVGVMRGLLAGNVGVNTIKVSRKIFGTTMPAFAYRVYCLRNSHMTPQVCTAIAKAMMLAPFGKHPLKRNTLKTTGVSKKDFKPNLNEDQVHDNFVRGRIRNCYTTAFETDDKFVEWAVDQLIARKSGKKRTKQDVNDIVKNLNKHQLEDEIVEKIKTVYKKIYEKVRKSKKQAREQADQAQVEEVNSKADEGADELRAALAAALAG